MATSTTDTDYAERGSDIPVHDLFREIRSRWLEKNPGATSIDLAERFGVHKQSISQWATGSDKTKQPPWWVMLSLCRDLNLEVRLADDGVRLMRKRRPRTLKEVVDELDGAEA